MAQETQPQSEGNSQTIDAYIEDEENSALKKPLLEAFEWVSNKSLAVLMSALTGESISATDVRRFKWRRHLKSFQEAQAKLDVAHSEKDANEWFVLDAVHKTRINPGATGSMAALQALRNIREIKEKEAEQNPSEAILTTLLEWIAGSAEFSGDQKKRIGDEVSRIQKSLEK